MKLPIRESDLIAGIVDGLRYRGRIVFRTGQWRADKAGNDVGLPDLAVYCPQLGVGCWKMLECKTPTGRVRPAQKDLADIGASVIVRSIEEAFKVCGEALETDRRQKSLQNGAQRP